MANQKQSTLFQFGGAGAVSIPMVRGESQELDLIQDLLTFSSSAQKYQEFTVNTDGEYRVGFDATVWNNPSQGSSSRFIQLEIRINGNAVPSLIRADGKIVEVTTGIEYDQISGSKKATLTAGDTVELWVWAANGGAISIREGVMYIDPVIQGTELVGSRSQKWTPITLTSSQIPESSQSFFFRRFEDTMILRGNFNSSGVATGTIVLELPSGYTIDFSKLPLSAFAPLGPVSSLDVGGPTGRHLGVALTNGSSTTQIAFTGDDGQDLWNATVPFAWGGSDRIELHSLEIPIVEWA